eukprot:scaffold93166_cov58-Attheya_sp.AAC.3
MVVVMPDTAGQTIVDCVELDNCDVPTALEVDAALSGNGPPVVMATSNNPTQSSLPQMMFVLKAWAGYFLDRKMPYDEAFKMMELLMGTLPVQAHRDKALPLMEWAWAVCVREGSGVAKRRASQQTNMKFYFNGYRYSSSL